MTPKERAVAHAVRIFGNSQGFGPLWDALVASETGRLEAVEVLRDVQWGSCDGCGNRRHCPECGGARTFLRHEATCTDAVLDHINKDSGHEPGCHLAHLLAVPE